MKKLVTHNGGVHEIRLTPEDEKHVKIDPNHPFFQNEVLIKPRKLIILFVIFLLLLSII